MENYKKQLNSQFWDRRDRRVNLYNPSSYSENPKIEAKTFTQVANDNSFQISSLWMILLPNWPNKAHQW